MVDIFMPVGPRVLSRFPAALYSALTQTYPDVRVCLFIDFQNDVIEEILNKWWYLPGDNRNLFPIQNPRDEHILTMETCQRGILFRNRFGPMLTGGYARQFLFDWEGKSEWVKMLDSDDILFPQAIEVMMRYAEDGVDGVLCPMFRISQCKYVSMVPGEPVMGKAGSGSMLLRSSFIDHLVKEGFVWENVCGHDKGLLNFFKDHDYTFVTTKENAMYAYIK